MHEQYYELYNIILYSRQIALLLTVILYSHNIVLATYMLLFSNAITILCIYSYTKLYSYTVVKVATYAPVLYRVVMVFLNMI